jgi:patatin-like phospholipase/acyl hydrolase
LKTVLQARLDPLENAQVKLVCQATAAAPTYLPPVHFTLTDPNTSAVREFNLIDGGVAVNNPTYVAITQAIKELHSGGTSAGRVEYAVSDLDSNPLMSGYSDVECSQCH